MRPLHLWVPLAIVLATVPTALAEETCVRNGFDGVCVYDTTFGAPDCDTPDSFRGTATGVSAEIGGFGGAHVTGARNCMSYDDGQGQAKFEASAISAGFGSVLGGASFYWTESTSTSSSGEQGSQCMIFVGFFTWNGGGGFGEQCYGLSPPNPGWGEFLP